MLRVAAMFLCGVLCTSITFMYGMYKHPVTVSIENLASCPMAPSEARVGFTVRRGHVFT